MAEHQTADTEAIVVTGHGVVNALGRGFPAFARRLASGEGGIRYYPDTLNDWGAWLGRVDEANSPVSGDDDRTLLLAAMAATEALETAGLWRDALQMPGETLALLLGTSHGGRSQLDNFVHGGMKRDDHNSATAVLDRGAHAWQTAALARLLGISGPVLTLSTACSSSGTAVVHGIDLLRSGKATAVLVGGADAFSQLTLAGFRALGAVADNPCGPFGETIGISLGEGAAFLLLERASAARARGQRALFAIYGAATSWDAYHMTAPDPAGDGMRRAIQGALRLSAAAPENMGYISAHGTGTRANDLAETLAIQRVFGAQPPPVSASKSFTGHTLGASSITGLLAAYAGMSGGWLPPTLNVSAARAGCPLDYVVGGARSATFGRFLALSAAFGGCNCAIAAGNLLPDDAAVPPTSVTTVPLQPEPALITGLGVISPWGMDSETAFTTLRSPAAMPQPLPDGSLRIASFNARQWLPPGAPARLNRISQLGIAAVEQALTQAGWCGAQRRPEAIGLMVALSRGAAASFESFLASVRDGAWRRASPTAFPHLVMSSVGGQIAQACGLKGAASTLIGEDEGGPALLALAASSLANQRELAAIVVVAADELAALFLDLERTRNGEQGVSMAEGAVALVLERQASAVARKAQVLARVTGWGQTFSPQPQVAQVDERRAATIAISQSGLVTSAPDLLVTTGCALPVSGTDNEPPARRVMTLPVPPGSAFGGLLAVSMAVTALQKGNGAQHTGAGVNSVLVSGHSRLGANSALVLQGPIGE